MKNGCKEWYALAYLCMCVVHLACGFHIHYYFFRLPARAITPFPEIPFRNATLQHSYLRQSPSLASNAPSFLSFFLGFNSCCC